MYYCLLYDYLNSLSCYRWEHALWGRQTRLQASASGCICYLLASAGSYTWSFSNGTMWACSYLGHAHSNSLHHHHYLNTLKGLEISEIFCLGNHFRLAIFLQSVDSAKFQLNPFVKDTSVQVGICGWLNLLGRLLSMDSPIL